MKNIFIIQRPRSRAIIKETILPTNNHTEGDFL